MLNTHNNFFGDATARLEGAVWQSMSLSLLPHTDWQPFPFWAHGLAIRLTGDDFYAPRLMSLLFASACIYPLFQIARKLFNRQTAVLSCLFFSLSIPHMLIETLTLSESFFHFFTLMLVWFSLKKTTTPTDLVLGTLFSALLCLTRMEGWIFCFILFVYSIFKKRKGFSWSIFLGAGIGVIYWETCSYFLGKGFLRALLFSDFEVEKAISHFDIPFLEAINRSFLGFSFFTTFVLFFGGFWVYQNKKAFHYYIITVLYWLPPLYKTLNGTLFPEFRYYTMYALMLFPILTSILLSVSRSMKKASQHAFIFIFIAGSLIFDFFWMNSKFDYNFHLFLKKGFLHSAEYFEKNINIEEKTLYIDFDSSWDRELWYVYSSAQRNNPAKVCKVESHHWLGEHFSTTSFNKCAENQNHLYLIIFPNGELERFLTDNKSLLSKTFTITTVKDFSGYKIVSLVRKNSV